MEREMKQATIASARYSEIRKQATRATVKKVAAKADLVGSILEIEAKKELNETLPEFWKNQAKVAEQARKQALVNYGRATNAAAKTKAEEDLKMKSEQAANDKARMEKDERKAKEAEQNLQLARDLKEKALLLENKIDDEAGVRIVLAGLEKLSTDSTTTMDSKKPDLEKIESNFEDIFQRCYDKWYERKFENKFDRVFDKHWEIVVM
jgi:hypothetical protein